MNHVIVNAIQNLHVLSLTYKGIPRKVEPHAYGINHKGHELLRCYQISGDHSSKRPHDWDLFDVSKIVGLTDSGERFAGPRSGYNRDDKGMTTIYAQI